MKHIIQDESGEWKEYQAHELPDGCVCQLPHFLVGEGFHYKSVKELRQEPGRRHKFGAIDSIIAIVDDNGESTHVKRWMATDYYGTTWKYFKTPLRSGFCYEQYEGAECIGKNICGQVWEDGPHEVWERIK